MVPTCVLVIRIHVPRHEGANAVDTIATTIVDTVTLNFRELLRLRAAGKIGNVEPVIDYSPLHGRGNFV